MALQLTKSSTPKEEYECAAHEAVPGCRRPRVDGHGTPGPVEQRRHHGDGQRADADQRAWRPAVDFGTCSRREQDGQCDRPHEAAALTVSGQASTPFLCVHTPGTLSPAAVPHADRQLRSVMRCSPHRLWCLRSRRVGATTPLSVRALFVWWRAGAAATNRRLVSTPFDHHEVIY